MQPIKKVVIVGGGTAGWLTATHIKSALDESVEVTLIESPNVPTVGVGEGTTTTLRSHFESLRVDEKDFLRKCGASFKNGIRFVGWCGGSGPDAYVHPFFSGSPGEQDSPVWAPHVWLRLYREGIPNLAPLPMTCWPESWLLEKKRAPVAFEDGQPTASPLVSYAYHMDAAKLGLFLRDIAIERGVVHIVDDVIGTTKSETGDLTGVHTKHSGVVEGEFFLDCTGFHRVLIKEIDDEFVDFGKHLLNDSALTVRVPYPNGVPRDIEACTVSTAMKHGWMWEIPLYDRFGAGYVYSSQFVSDEEAEREFREKLGDWESEVRRIRFRSGCLRRSWVRNCAAIGLSSGFMEPLEATGIAMITHALFRLLENWPDTTDSPVLRDSFNDNLFSSYEWIRDFIAMHFCYSQRTDTPYWQAVRQPESIPDTLRRQVEYYDQRWPFGGTLEPQHGYRVLQSSLFCVLAGFDKYPQSPNAYVQALPVENVKAIMNQASQRIRGVVKLCRDHAEYLNWLNGEQVLSNKSHEAVA